jgi:large subunit ribosomal protein L28
MAKCAITGRKKSFGNNVPFSKKTTRRSWDPNVHKRTLYVPELGRNVTLFLSTAALRTMEKKGGLMNYLRDEGLTLNQVTRRRPAA